MTNKEFEDRKRVIIHELHNLGLAGVSFTEGQLIVNLINELQLPQVKKLEWIEQPECCAIGWYNSHGWWSNLIYGVKHEIIIRYAIHKTQSGYVLRSIVGISSDRSYLEYADSLDEAKQMAQSHFEQTILGVFE